jgi:hypothetical protein
LKLDENGSNVTELKLILSDYNYNSNTLPRKSIVPGSVSSLTSLYRNSNNHNSLPPPPDKPRPAIPTAFIKPQVAYEDSFLVRTEIIKKVNEIIFLYFLSQKILH